MTFDREALAWAAGFFDGEGHVRMILSGHGGYPTMALEISQSADPPLLTRFQRAVGVGKVGGPYAGTKNQTPYHRYRLYGFEKVQHVMAILWPWLGDRKREQFTNAFTARSARSAERLPYPHARGIS